MREIFERREEENILGYYKKCQTETFQMARTQMWFFLDKVKMISHDFFENFNLSYVFLCII